MFIKKITLKNFKSFKELSINLNNFNVLIGANNSGKSNFIQVFRFIKDLVKYGFKQ
jgi:predicted ATPase